MTDLQKWIDRYLELAKHISTWSKDTSTQVGAVITKENRIVSVGYNGLPVGVEDSEEILNNRELKLAQVVHAEMNAILTSKRDLTGCTLFVWPFMPCSTCASMIIQTGISTVIAPANYPDRWKSNFEISKKNFQQAGINFIEVAKYVD